ncbi:MAG: sugar ABC transporter permease [Chloroflexi bacterium]|nr:sugar ABC transporter permease [Chloroflexota bacterium]
MRKLLPWLLLAPSLLVIGVVQLYPALWSVWLSFQKVAGVRTAPVGLRNYALVFGSRAFAESLWHTAFFLFGYVVLTLLLGLGIALLLNRKLKLGTAYASLLFVPWVLSDVIVGLVFKLFVDPDTGLFAPFFAQPLFGLQGSALLTHVPTETFIASVPFPPAPALIYLIVAAVWKALPFTTLLALAALQTVPREVTESAALDGAGGGRMFAYITLPLILPQVLAATFSLIIGGMNGVGMVFALTGGGPGTSTEVLSLLLYSIGFSALDLGRAAALSVFIAAVNLLLLAAALRASRARGER